MKLNVGASTIQEMPCAHSRMCSSGTKPIIMYKIVDMILGIDSHICIGMESLHMAAVLRT